VVLHAFNIKAYMQLDLYPQKLNWLLRLPWRGDRSIPGVLKRFDNLGMVAPYDAKNLVQKATPETLPMKVTEILPRWKDGYVVDYP
jgi:hypothetical protein